MIEEITRRLKKIRGILWQMKRVHCGRVHCDDRQIICTVKEPLDIPIEPINLYW